MDEQKFVQYLMEFGLTRQEALIYKCLLTEGKMTGYEVAKATGISRSNAYGSLAALVEKGGAYGLEETAKKYVAVSLDEFCENHIRNLQGKKKWLLLNLPKEQEAQGSYITIEGREHVLNKITHLLSGAKERVYISCAASFLPAIEEVVKVLANQQKKIVIITDGTYYLPGTSVYYSKERGMQIGIIADSRFVLTGEAGEGSSYTCLYSDEPNFVEVFKNAMANEIKLIQYEKGE